MLFLVALLVALPGGYGSTTQGELQSAVVLNDNVLEKLPEKKAIFNYKTREEIRDATDDAVSQHKSIHEELKAGDPSQIMSAIIAQELEESRLPDPAESLIIQTQSMYDLEGIMQGYTILAHKIFAQEMAMRALDAMLSEQKKIAQSKNKRVQKLEARLRLHKEKIQTQEEKIQTQEEEIKAQERDIQAQEERIQTQEEKIQTQEERIQTQEEKIQTQEEKIQTQEEKIQTQEEKIQTQEGKIQTQEEKIQTQEEKIQAQEQKIQHFLEVRELKRQQETETVPSTIVETSLDKNETKHLPQDCSHYWTPHQNESGRYTIFPVIGGPGVDVWCDMRVDGPWTVIMSRSPQPHQENFSRSWEEYKAGFGNASTEYWLGLDALHALTSRTPHLLKVQIQFFDGQDYDGGLRKFVVSDEDSQYEVRMEGGYGIGKYLLVNNGMKFTTTDRDNDQSSFDCAKIEGGGGWWYGRVDMHAGGTAWSSLCTLANPTGKVATSDYGLNGVMSWPFEEKKRYISLKKVVMKIQPNYK